MAYNSPFASVAGLDLPALLRRHRATAASLLAGWSIHMALRDRVVGLTRMAGLWKGANVKRKSPGGQTHTVIARGEPVPGSGSANASLRAMTEKPWKRNTVMPYRYDAVLFDLLTALLDSWTLWDDIAGDEPSGRRWRTEYLRLTYGTGAYRRYETLVAEAAATVGLDRRLADTLAERYSELQPWPGVAAALGRLAAARVPLGIATNCSEDLARLGTLPALPPIGLASRSRCW